MKIKFVRHTLISLTLMMCWVLIMGVAVGYGFLTTSVGAQMITSALIQSYLPSAQIKIASLEGTIQKGVLLKNIEISNMAMMKNAVLNIQELHLELPIVFYKQLTAKAINGRLSFPSSDPIVFNLQIKNDQLSGNLYAKNIDAKEIVLSLGYGLLARDIKGFLSRIDFIVDGPITVPHLKGHFLVDEFTYQETLLKDGFSRLDLSILSLGERPLMQGQLIMESANVKVSKIPVELTTSKAEFKGDVTNPLLDIYGSTKADDILIDMTIKGSLQKPKLSFSSDPPMSEADILTVLIRKGWSSIGANQAQTIGLRRDIGEGLNVGMKIEQNTDKLGQRKAAGYAQTIEGQLNVTDKISFNLSQKYLSARDELNSTATGTQTNKNKETEFTVQYKKRF